MPLLDSLADLRASKKFAVAIVFFGIFADITGYSVIIPIIPFILNDIGQSETWTGILLTIYGVGVVCGSLSFGYAATRNRISKRFGMILSLFIVWAAILLFALSNSIWMLCIARLLQGFASCGVFVLGLAYVADVYDDDQSNLGVVMSFIFSGLALGQLVGPPVGGALFDAGKYYPFIFTALLVAVDFIGRVLIIDKPKHAPAESVPVHQADLDSTAIELIVATDRSPTESVPKSTVVVEQNPSEFSIRSLFKMRELLVLCGLCLILAVVLTQLEPTVPLYINALYGYNSAQIGALFLAFVLPNITGGMLGGWMFDKYGMRLVSIIGLPASFISLILLGLPQPVHIAWTIFA
ncbi:hypothetical protein HDU82_000167, partial [Entophlyctis luteolus]